MIYHNYVSIFGTLTCLSFTHLDSMAESNNNNNTDNDQRIAFGLQMNELMMADAPPDSPPPPTACSCFHCSLRQSLGGGFGGFGGLVLQLPPSQQVVSNVEEKIMRAVQTATFTEEQEVKESKRIKRDVTSVTWRGRCEAAATSGTCPICLECYAVGDEVFLTACEHTMHPLCMKQAIEWSDQCPVCREKIDETVAT